MGFVFRVVGGCAALNFESRSVYTQTSMFRRLRAAGLEACMAATFQEVGLLTRERMASYLVFVAIGGCLCPETRNRKLCPKP